MLVRDPDGRQFPGRARGLGKRRVTGPGDQDEACRRRVREPVNRGGIAFALLLQTGKRAEAGCISLTGLQEVLPRPGQLQKPDGVTRRRSVEDDMIIPVDHAGIGQKTGELVECGDLGRAGTG